MPTSHRRPRERQNLVASYRYVIGGASVALREPMRLAAD